MINIIGKNTNKTFTLNEAQSLLPLIYRFTEEASREVKYLMACIEALKNQESPRSLELQESVNKIIEKWQNKMERLGTRPKGLWLADFDHGNGYYCWKFPESDILYTHGYQDGFSGRTLIQQDQRFHENSPSTN